MRGTRSPKAIDAGTDAAARARRRARREQLNSEAGRRLGTGTAAVLAGGICWGISGTCASFLFGRYGVDTVWLMSVRQILAGALFLVVALATDRACFLELWRTPVDRRTLLVFTVFGLFVNQYFYLVTVRLTNAGTATVLQCLNILLVLFIACLQQRRGPRRRESAGIVLALVGTVLLATGGDLSRLAIPPAGLASGLLNAVGTAAVSIIPVRILSRYGSASVTGSAMFLCGVVSCAVARPWENPPALDGTALATIAVLVVIGSFAAYFLYMLGVGRVGAVRASLLGTVEPISAAVTSALALGTVFAPTDLAGFALIILMVFLTA